MKYINKLSEAKSLANVEGSVLYVSNKGRIRKELSGKEKQLYKIECKNGTQYIYDENNNQIIPKEAKEAKEATGKTTGKCKSNRVSASELQNTSDASMD